MTFDQSPFSHGEGYDTEAIRRFWDRVLHRLKVYAELTERSASRTDRCTTPPTDGDETQTEPGDG